MDRNVNAGTKLASIEVVLHRRHSSTFCLLENCTCWFTSNNFSGIPSVSNRLDPDQGRHFVGPDLGPNFFAKVIRRRNK